MKRSCFALSILMASLSGSLLWGDAAKSSSRAASRPAVSARDAIPRPPRVDAIRCDGYDCPSRADNAACDDFDCGYAWLPYDTCSYDPRLHERREQTGPCEPVCQEPGEVVADMHPSDLPEAIQEVETPLIEKFTEIDPLFLSHYDRAYDAAVYGVDVYVSEDAAYQASESRSEYRRQTYDYQAYMECASEGYSCYDYACSDYDYGYADNPPVSVAEVARPAAEEEVVQLYGHYYEYDYDYEYDYHYEYDYDAADNEKVEVKETEPVPDAALIKPHELRAVLAHVGDLLEGSMIQCEPLQAALEAGCKIVAWSSGFNAAQLLDAAGAQIADLPTVEAPSTR